MEQVTIYYDRKITIEPKLYIGQELWFMYANKPTLTLVCGYDVSVSGRTDTKRGLYDQLFARFRTRHFRKEKEHEQYVFRFTYKVKAEGNLLTHDLIEKNGAFYLYRERMYLSKEELIESLKPYVW